MDAFVLGRTRCVFIGGDGDRGIVIAECMTTSGDRIQIWNVNYGLFRGE